MYSAKPSYWEKTTFLSNIDIAVIGAGLVGTSAAIYLRKQFPSAKIVVFDRGFISSGASTKNAGFACFGSISEVLDDLTTTSSKDIFNLLAKRYEGMINLLELCGKENIDYQQGGGFEMFKKSDNTFANECLDQISYFNQEIKQITGIDETYLLQNDKISESKFKELDTCIANVAEGQLHPGKMMERLYFLARAQNILFYHGAKVRHINEQASSVQMELSNGWLIEANKLLIANNGFAKKLLPELKLQTVRNQVLVTSRIPNLAVKGTFHMHKGYFYFRNIDSRILIGGGRHLDKQRETTDSFGDNTLIEDALIELLGSIVLPDEQYAIEHKWSGILGVGQSKLPILEKHSDHITLAVRLGGMGVALGSLLGKEAAQLV